MKCWAIRQKSTGYFLPMRWKRACGYSYDEPTEGAFPRLFPSEKSANSALSAWLRGTWSEPKEYDHDEWSHTEYVRIFSPVSVEGRSKDDMEVVAMELSIREDIK